MYVATVNVPGYLPMDDEPPTFDTASEAWSYLAEQLRENEDQLDLPGDSYSGTVLELEANSMQTMADGTPYNFRGTVYGPTPGYDGDHDLGLAYSVDIAENDESETES
jgi:hypothetical protein